MKRTLTTLFLLCTAASAQTLASPAYSTARVDQLAHAIGSSEGFYQRGTKPARLHNPGDIRGADGHYKVFASDADGFAALRAQIVRVITGNSKHYNLDMSIKRVGMRYAGAAIWSKNVARKLGVPESATLRSYLCGGDLDQPPVLVF
jgi:hypothetical protein